jgi:hypothetical protein
VGIHWLLHSSCCFLNTNTAITWQPIRTARTLQAEWWQGSGEVWVRGGRKRSQGLGAFGLLHFTMLLPLLLGTRFLTYEPYISLIFHFFSGRGQPWITETANTESADTAVHMYIWRYEPRQFVQKITGYFNFFLLLHRASWYHRSVSLSAQHTHLHGLDTTCCCTTAYCITTYC